MTDLPTRPADFPDEFVRHHRPLWLVAMSIVANASDADEVMQEAAIIGLRKADAFVPGTSFRAWMGAIVRNVALNRRRQTKRELRRFGARVDAHDLSTPSATRAESPLAGIGGLRPHQESFDDRVLSALMQLEPIPRACMMLRSIEELDYDQIAQLLDIPRGTAMSHVFRSRQTLAKLLSDPAEGGK